MSAEYKASQQNLIPTSTRSHLEKSCFDIYHCRRRESSFAADETTRLLASPLGKANIMFGFNTLNKAFQDLSDSL